MFAIGHAATALVIKRRYPSVPMLPVLLSVQAMEFAWVGLNYAGLERTSTADTVRTVADIHLAYMPFSHSVGTALAGAALAWALIDRVMGRRDLARAVGLGILSHLVLDLATHARDIVPAPGWSQPGLGLGLYLSAPLAAFVLELGYGICCWLVYRGSPALLVLIVAGNVANLSFFSASLSGPEAFLANRPMLVVTMVFLQIVVTLTLVGVFSRQHREPGEQLLPSRCASRGDCGGRDPRRRRHSRS